MGETILIIDDEAAIRCMLRDRLEAAGYRVIEAEAGHAGLEAAMKHEPDLIILDTRMPDMYGHEVCNHLRARPSFDRVPIVFLSANVRDDAKCLAREAGASCYLTKPFEAAHILDTIARLLREPTEPAQAVTPPPRRPAC